MKIENDKKTNLLDSLVRATQSKPQKEQAAEKRNSDSTLDKVELSSRKTGNQRAERKGEG